MPRAPFVHLPPRIEQRRTSTEVLSSLATWLDKNPAVPTRDWFKRFSTMTVGGREPRVKVLLAANQVAIGQEIEA